MGFLEEEAPKGTEDVKQADRAGNSFPGRKNNVCCQREPRRDLAKYTSGCIWLGHGHVTWGPMSGP